MMIVSLTPLLVNRETTRRTLLSMGWFRRADSKAALLPVEVHLDGVIDDKVSGTHRVDLLGVAPQLHHRVPHGGKVHHGGHPAGEEETEGTAILSLFIC